MQETPIYDEMAIVRKTSHLAGRAEGALMMKQQILTLLSGRKTITAELLKKIEATNVN